MPDNNLSVEEIIAMYSKKLPSAKKEEPSVSELAEAVLTRKPTSTKTELIEDVLEIGDNHLVVTPTPEETPEAPKPEPVKAAPQPKAPEPVRPTEAPKRPKADFTLSDIGIRQAGKTSSGTRAIEEISKNKEQNPEPQPQSAVQNQPKKPAVLKPLSENPDDSKLVEDLRRLKQERSQSRHPANVQPVNRASIGSIGLDIDKKVIPSTEVGIGEGDKDSEKIEAIKADRREKAKQFVVEEGENKQTGGTSVADFESFEQAKEMSQSIAGLKKSLVVRLAVLAVCTVASALLTILPGAGTSVISSLDPVTAQLFLNVLLCLAACFVSFTVITVGLKKLFTMKADSDSLSAISVILTIVPSIALLSDTSLVERRLAHCYICVAILGLLANTVGKLLIVIRTQRSFKYISGGYSKYAALHIDNEDVAGKFTKGALKDFPSLSTARKTEFVSDFIKNSYSPDLTDSFSKIYVPVIALASLVLGVICYFISPEGVAEPASRLCYALASMGGCAAVCSAVGTMLAVNIPLYKASKKYMQSSAVMLGYSAVEQFADTNSVLVDAKDLFPDGMVEIVNLKPAKKMPIESGIIYAASLCCQTESILRSAFYKMIKGKTEMLMPVESYIYEDGLGLSGWIENKRVLFGNRTLMESHSVQNLPTVEKEREYAKGDIVVYLSVGGTLAMIFVVRLNASVEVAESLKDLQKQDITVIIRSVDSHLSITKLSELFGVQPNLFKLLPFRYHTDYNAQTSYIESVSSPMVYSGRFSALAMLLVGTKRLLRSSTLGVAIQALSAIIGLVLALIFAFIGDFGGLFSGTVVIVYNLIWLGITAIVQSLLKT